MSVYHIAANRLRATPILTVKTESPTVKTFTFKDAQCAKAQPGQFVMLWIPGVDEIPLSILDVDEDGLVSVAVKSVGEATQALHEAKAGHFIGVRGPFGNSFAMVKGRVLMVAGNRNGPHAVSSQKTGGQNGEGCLRSGRKNHE